MGVPGVWRMGGTVGRATEGFRRLGRHPGELSTGVGTGPGEGIEGRITGRAMTRVLTTRPHLHSSPPLGTLAKCWFYFPLLATSCHRPQLTLQWVKMPSEACRSAPLNSYWAWVSGPWLVSKGPCMLNGAVRCPPHPMQQVRPDLGWKE